MTPMTHLCERLVCLPERVQLRRTKGWRLPENTVSVARPGKFGNPFPVDVYGKVVAVHRFRQLLTGQMSTLKMSQSSTCDQWTARGLSLVFVRRMIVDALPELRGKNLACWCGAGPCHADVLLELANDPTPMSAPNPRRG